MLHEYEICVKIGIIYQKFISTGGMEAYLFRFAQELINSGHQLQVITAQTDPATEALGASIQKVNLPAVSSKASGPPRQGFTLEAYRLQTSRSWQEGQR